VDVGVAVDTLRQLYDLAKGGHAIYPADIRRSAEIVRSGKRLSDVFLDAVLVVSGRKRIAPKNLNQKRYIDAIRNHDLTFGIGPAGTGKTYLAMALAVSALASREVKRIILTRPAVEAGERLGFLPGDMADKVNPYLRPLYDALYDMMDSGRVQRLMHDEVIEVAPLAFMRGRTLNDCFVVLDEAQNTTREQMKMFLTRLGSNARAVVTGDVTQTDLADGAVSGLVHARAILHGTEGIAFSDFGPDDVVRHPLVMRIIRAYERETARPRFPTAPMAVSADDD
jgi:phosphate starvation-inducible PhoH-like protein